MEPTTVKLIHTAQRHTQTFTKLERDWIYNGLDCCLTREIFDVIAPQLGAETSRTYAFSRALQGPILDMRLRGLRVDQDRVEEVVDELYAKLDQLYDQLNRIVTEGLDFPDFNWSSNPSLQELFYDILHIPPVKHQGRVTTNEAALEKIAAKYPIARQLVRHILAMRGLQKRISVLRTPLDPDGRIRTSYNIAGTSTGRLSSSLSEFGTGGNLQNVEEALRSIFIADPGMKFAKFDAKSGESYVVGAIEWNLFGDGTFLDALESGDIHTAVARLVWPDLPWTGDIKKDKAIAEQPFYRHHTYRFMCKKLGHGSNYGGQPFTLAQQTHLPISIVEEFQPKYFAAFPAHQRWQRHVADELYQRGYLVSLMGRKRWFHGRRNDPATIREAIAFDPQSSLADIVNRAMLRLWMSPNFPILVANDHDALTFTYPEDEEDSIVPALHAALPERIELKNGRVLSIPYDCKTGWNRADVDPDKNPEGLKDYHGTDERRRKAPVGFLDRSFRPSNRAHRRP
jgi:DNA polymerase-1